MTMTIDEIDAEIAVWERRRDNWLLGRSFRGADFALRGVRVCVDEIEKLRRQRLALTEQTERK